MNSGDAGHPGLRVSARTEGCITVAELAGELDVGSAPHLREQLLSLLRPGSSRLIIDLSRVSFCDASGLAVLVGTDRRAELLGGYMRLAAVPPEVGQILRITGLQRHFLISATVSDALRLSGAPPGETGAAGQRARAAKTWHAFIGKPAGRPRVTGDYGELRRAIVALLTHVQAWHDADPGRRFTPALHAMALAAAGTDDAALDATARSLLSTLARHPLTHSPAVAETATRLRWVLRPPVTSALD